MSYLIKEVFYTLQGEGRHAGTPAVFVRLAGCNMWSGRAATRLDDADRTGAACPLWCDTDFVGGTRMSADEVAVAVVEAGGDANPELVILTGGEPLLQADAALVLAIQSRSRVVNIETNGTVTPRDDAIARRWITLSPKLPHSSGLADGLAACVNEIKVVYPVGESPAVWNDMAERHAWLRYVQPLADGDGLVAANMKEAAQFVMANPKWRLSVQMHKVVGLE